MPQRGTQCGRASGLNWGSISTDCSRTPILAPPTKSTFLRSASFTSPTVTSKEFEFALRRDVVLEGGDALFPQDSIRLLFRDAQFDDDLPDVGEAFVYDFNDANEVVLDPIALAKAIPRICVSVRTMCSATVSFIQFANRDSNESSPP